MESNSLEKFSYLSTRNRFAAKQLALNRLHNVTRNLSKRTLRNYDIAKKSEHRIFVYCKREFVVQHFIAILTQFERSRKSE